jgi:virginiamycin B lyase
MNRVPAPPASRRSMLIGAGLGLLALAAAGLLLVRGSPTPRFTEHRMSDPQDAPTAIAAAADGTIWFTMDHAEAIGRLREGRIERLPTPARNIDPIGLAAAADGSVWYTDIASRAVVRVAPDGAITRFAIDAPIVRLGRLAIAPDGAVWFADATGSGITRLKDGIFTPHRVEDARGPYGVAVSSDGTVWATLQGGNQLIRIAPDGAIATVQLPRPGAVPTDIAVGTDGSVWYLEFRANRIGRWKDGVFESHEVGKENAGLSGLAVDRDGTVWFGMLRQSSLGRLRAGRIESFRLPRENARPYSLAVDRDSNVWYADISGYVGMLAVGR